MDLLTPQYSAEQLSHAARVARSTYRTWENRGYVSAKYKKKIDGKTHHYAAVDVYEAAIISNVIQLTNNGVEPAATLAREVVHGSETQKILTEARNADWDSEWYGRFAQPERKQKSYLAFIFEYASGFKGKAVHVHHQIFGLDSIKDIFVWAGERLPRVDMLLESTERGAKPEDPYRAQKIRDLSFDYPGAPGVMLIDLTDIVCTANDILAGGSYHGAFKDLGPFVFTPVDDE